MPPPSVAAWEPIPGLTRAHRVFTMIATLLGLFLAALDQTIVATAGPEIQRDLGIAPSLYVWITTAYLVASTVLVPIYGKLSDLYGRRAVLVTGISIFTLGSALCGVAQTSLQLILFRAVQGVGSAALFTTAFAVIADLYPPAERGKYQGMFGGVFGISSVVGPLAGGVITDAVGWHWVFFVNVPIGALALAFVIARMPPLLRGGGGRVDVAGACALVVTLLPLLLALSLGKSVGDAEGAGWPWGSWQILALFGASAAGLIAFLTIERRVRDPIFDLALFRGRAFALGALAAFLAGASFLAAIVFLPLFMVRVVGLSATHSGLTTTPLTLGIVGGNVLAGQLVARLGRYKGIIVASLALAIVAFGLLGFGLGTSSTQRQVAFFMVLLGLGVGPSIPLYTLAVQSAVPVRQLGVATSTATFARQLGATVGLAVVGTIFATTFAAALPGAASAPEAFSHATRTIFRVCMGIAAAGLAVTLALPEIALRARGP
jgi:EmrB/QacA subfamily drug resistance transporter